jgi:hypothetical protein
MNKETLVMKLIEMLISGEVSQAETKSDTNQELVGKPVIVRSRYSGVHFGYYNSHKGREVNLTNCRRMWRWWAAKQMTLSAVAEFGLNHEKDLRIQNTLPSICILDACEIIPCTEIAKNSIESVEVYDEQ